ncbi:MAG: protein-(glutamine-N5) methyltransferase, release factor-specific [Elusimicrobia bacterium RIFOXYB2_FULL_49_7]|nr:MAG: protein-(glutamine-N5) methyltransferase, release factor-specific [Elusimicrobia bacterium RIFOXYB2_FULL_49_7]
MNTVLDILKKSSGYFLQKGIESPRLNAERLLCHLLACRRLDLYLNFDKPLHDAEVDKLRTWVVRRGRFEPLEYITGTCEFMDISLSVTSAVLIPRPETELLAEAIFKRSQALTPSTILDLCTGSGVLAIYLKKHLPETEITGSDISENALQIASDNAKQNQVDVRFVRSDLFESFSNERFDVIVSNPPYVRHSELVDLQREVRDYEPHLALDGGVEGLDFYQRILTIAKNHLSEKGMLYFELGEGQKENVAEMAKQAGFHLIDTIPDYAAIPRVLILQSSE